MANLLHDRKNVAPDHIPSWLKALFFLTPLGTANAQIAPFPEAIPIERPLVVGLIKKSIRTSCCLIPQPPPDSGRVYKKP